MIISKQESDKLDELKKATEALNFHLKHVKKYTEEVNSLSKDVNLTSYKTSRVR